MKPIFCLQNYNYNQTSHKTLESNWEAASTLSASSKENLFISFWLFRTKI